MFRLLKLKPPNGWNAVAWELAIVTLGVFIALAAQEWASDLNSRRKAKAATAALKAEVGQHYANSVEFRLVAPCILAQIDRLQQLLTNSGDRLEPAPVFSETGISRFVLRMPSKAYDSSAWEAAIADGVTSHLLPQMRGRLSQHYSQVQSAVAITGLNDADNQSLFSLSRPIALNPSVRFSLMQTLDRLHGRVDYMDLTSGQLLDNITNAGMVPDASVSKELVARSGTRIFCTAQRSPMRTLAEAMTPVPYAYAPLETPDAQKP